jgi:hypothetical protein
MSRPTETTVAKAGRIAARVATIALAIAAVAVKLSVDKALAELAEARRDDGAGPASPWR